MLGFVFQPNLQLLLFLIACLLNPFAFAESANPPLVASGEFFQDYEQLIANISRRSPVTAVAFSPDGALLASGSGDNTVRLWDVEQYKTLWTLAGGQRGTWVMCRASGQCWRHDDGTLLVRIEENNQRVAVPPETASSSKDLEVTVEADKLIANDGKATDFTVKVRNRGSARAYWHPQPAALRPGVSRFWPAVRRDHSHAENPARRQRAGHPSGEHQPGPAAGLPAGKEGSGAVWSLYHAISQDYQSPIKNFGATHIVGALEPEACRELITKPMAALNLRYESDALVERIIEETGRRANLIAITGNAILKDIDPTSRVINAGNVARALEDHDIRDALGGWQKLSDDKVANRLDQIIIYATVGLEHFTLAELMQLLDDRGCSYDPEQLKLSLLRLELAFILGLEQGRYFFRVPLFRDMVRKAEPERSLVSLCRS